MNRHQAEQCLFKNIINFLIVLYCGVSTKQREDTLKRVQMKDIDYICFR